MKISVSMGNSKMGRIPSISLPPVTSCRTDAPCAEDCYAMKAWRMYPATRNAWSRNLQIFRLDRVEYFCQIGGWLLLHKPKFFRFHVAGDIPSWNYFIEVIMLAHRHPKTKFLMFTKQYGFVNLTLKETTLPENLKVRFSAWPGLELVNPHGLPVAWMQDGTETRIPEGTAFCEGNCIECLGCWNNDNDVVFNKH